MAVIDLRSDTVTKPTPAMREAMARAEVGDDGYGEDPNANALETLAAAMFGKEAALLVPGGTMANLTALLAQVERNSEVILEETCHIMRSELGGVAGVAAALPRPLRGKDGAIDLDLMAAAIQPSLTTRRLRTALICLENTHNAAGGTVLPVAYLEAARALALSHGIRVHVDGSRIFNAAAALGVPVRDLARHADTISFCLSKGLSAPAGALLVGPKATIERARAYRRMLGGMMRQVGVIAAAGIVALEQMVDRLAEDHASAQLLARGLARLDRRLVDPARVQTNLVFADVASGGVSAAQASDALKARGVLCGAATASRLRFVTHREVSSADVATALAAFGEFWSDIQAAKTAAQ